jgi:UDP-glucose 4-epimerase
LKLTDRKILITGAAGFIGSHVADRLSADNDLVLLDDFSIGPRRNLATLEVQSNVEVVEADITEREAMLDLFSGIDVVIHMAISCLRTSLPAPELSHDINAGGTLNVLMAARAHEIERFLYVSSSEIYGSAQTVPMSESHPVNPTTVYGASKLAGELYALAYWRTYALPVSVVRPFNTYGPRSPYEGARSEVIPRFILQLEAGRAPVIYGDGSQTRDFTYVDDTVAGIVSAAKCDALVGDVVNVAYGSEASVAHIAEALAALIGREDLISVREAARPGDVDRHYADISKAQRLLKYEPAIPLDAGLERTLAWFRSEGIAETVDPEAAGKPNW